MRILRQNQQLPEQKYAIYSDPFVAGGLQQVLVAWHQHAPAQRVSLEKLIQITEQLLQINDVPELK